MRKEGREDRALKSPFVFQLRISLQTQFWSCHVLHLFSKFIEYMSGSILDYRESRVATPLTIYMTLEKIQTSLDFSFLICKGSVKERTDL